MAEKVARYDMIQVLRFIAATLVVCGHTLIHVGEKVAVSTNATEFFAWAGGWSVTLFFCISGFVITHAAQRISSLEFLARRVFRIYLGYLLAAAFVAALKFFVFGGLPVGEFSLAALSLLPMGQIPYPLWIEWSLVFEVFFYFLFSVFWLFRSNRVLLVCASLWLAAICITARGAPSPRLVSFHEVFLSARNIPFILGIMCYFAVDKLSAKIIRLLLPLGIFLAFSVDIFNSDFWRIAGQSLSSFFVLCWAANKPISRDRLAVDMGDYSYGIYLVHTSVIMILISATPLLEKGATSAVFVAFVIAMAVGASFGFAEHVIHERGKRIFRKDSRFRIWLRSLRGRDGISADQPT